MPNENWRHPVWDDRRGDKLHILLDNQSFSVYRGEIWCMRVKWRQAYESR
jgi:hypothetical protein